MTDLLRSRRGLVLTFLLGVALGAGAMRAYFTHTLGTWDPADRFAAKLSNDLGLDAGQRRRIEGVLADQRERMEELRKLWKVDVRLLARDGEDRIADLLTSAQMDVYMKRHDEIHGRMVRFLWVTDSNPTAIAVAPKP
jgi:hypothetical protein